MADEAETSSMEVAVRASSGSELAERSILLAIDGESHTLGNALRDVMWSHPHVQLASYTQEHPTSSELLLRCQTDSAVTAEQAVVEALEITKTMLAHVEESMDAAWAEWEQRSQQQQQQAGEHLETGEQPMEQG